MVGPVSRLSAALEIAGEARLDGAILDINLAGENSFPVARLLRKRRVPFLFLTGYTDISFVPPDLRDVPRLFKPFGDYEVAAVAGRLFAPTWS